MIEKTRFMRWLSYPFHPRKLWTVFKRRSYLTLYRLIRPTPDLVVERNWDNLIVLDACRFDAFAQLNRIPGKLSKVVSPGSRTEEWMIENFRNKKMKDVIYVSANPYGSYFKLPQLLGANPFYKVVEVWKNGWNEKLKTVHPSAVNDAAFINLRKYPGKRFIIHYIQPHYPFIGRVRLRVEGVSWLHVRKAFLENRKDLGKREYTVWHALRDGKLDVQQVWKAYVANLKLVLDYVENLLPHLTGAIHITSDHGNAFRRFGIFCGHPGNTPLPELIEVPLLEVEK